MSTESACCTACIIRARAKFCSTSGASARTRLFQIMRFTKVRLICVAWTAAGQDQIHKARTSRPLGYAATNILPKRAVTYNQRFSADLICTQCSIEGDCSSTTLLAQLVKQMVTVQACAITANMRMVQQCIAPWLPGQSAHTISDTTHALRARSTNDWMCCCRSDCHSHSRLHNARRPCKCAAPSRWVLLRPGGHPFLHCHLPEGEQSPPAHCRSQPDNPGSLQVQVTAPRQNHPANERWPDFAYLEGGQPARCWVRITSLAV